jgi:glycosyltransferase involved in cell wall biosynthesis
MAPSVTFILSGSGKNPVGGFKIVYEYANHLAIKGWNVTVVHPHIISSVNQGFIKKVKLRLQFYRSSFFKNYLPLSWFKINPKVRMMLVPNLRERYIPNADYIIACPAESAFFVNSYSPKKGKKFYFIQHFEDWSMKKEGVEKTWKLPLHKIVIAKWLKDLANSYGEESTYIPNGLDFSFFINQNPFKNRYPKSIVFASHISEFKGEKYAIKACRILKEKYPDIVIKTFSIYKKPEDFPSFIEYYYNPPQDLLKYIYNSAAIFLAPNLSEGWNLPLCEAILCGCVAIATDINGHREYMQDGINGFYCKPASTESIVEKFEYIISNPEIARKISENGHLSLKKFDWDSRVELFEQALLRG